MGLAFVRQGGFGVRLFVVSASGGPSAFRRTVAGPAKAGHYDVYGTIQVAPWSSVRIVRPSVVTTVARRPSVAWMETKSVR